MKTVAIVIVDTHQHNRMAKLAIEKTLRCNIAIKTIYSISNKPIIQGEKFYHIRPINSLREYSDIIINLLPYIVEEDHFFVVQWDGFVTRPELWANEFFDYDYIGAPWGGIHIPEGGDPGIDDGGNGGFSFRSRKLLNAAKQIPVLLSAHTWQAHAEDVVLCRHYRAELRALGINFAPRDVGERFSSEGATAGDHLGFHGVPNLGLHLSEATLIEHASEIILRTHHDVALIYFFVNLLSANKKNVYHEYFRLLKFNDKRLNNIINLLNNAAVDIPLFNPALNL